MARSITQRLELLTNLAIIVAAVLLSIVLTKNYLLPDRSKDGSRDFRVPAGVKVSLPGVDWSNNNQTLLLVLQKGMSLLHGERGILPATRAGDRGTRKRSLDRCFATDI